MKRFLPTILLSLLFTVCASAQTPDVRIKTNIYATDGATNSFTLVLGAATGHSGYADIVCSGGNTREAEIITAYYDDTDSTLVGTNISCQVDEQGVVEVYCDEGVLIDYLSCSGAEITSVEFKHPEAVAILALEHNALEELDLTAFTGLMALYLNDNPFSKTPLMVGAPKPNLAILELSLIDNLDPAFDIAPFPNLKSFDAMSTHGLTHVTASACPELLKLSIDNTSVSELDLSANANLYILNISETRIKDIDLSPCTRLQQFYATHSSAFNSDVKLDHVDLSGCSELLYLFLNDNNLTSLDLSACTKLLDLYVRNNRLTSLDLSACPYLYNVMISGNCLDYNTLPVQQDTWGSYEYDQRALDVPSSYLIGSTIDLSDHLWRDDYETYMGLFYVNEATPATTTEVSETLYTFDKGRIVINEVIDCDSLFAVFYNPLFPDTQLETRRFRVKDTDTYGQPDCLVTIGSSLAKGANITMSVGIVGASETNPKTFYVNLGDGKLTEFKATTELTPATPNVNAVKPLTGTMNIYLPEGEQLSALAIRDLKLTSLDVTAARQLRELTLVNTKLKSLDLQWCRCLESVEITGNSFGADFTLAGANGYYGKNVLSHINLASNKMTEVTLNEPGSINYLDLHDNQLTSLSFTDADYITYLDLSHNKFDYLKVNYCAALKTFLCNNNALTALVLPEENNIEYFDCSSNCFTLATMPDRNGLDEEHFRYAPQQVIQIPTKGPGYNLSAQDVEADGHQTVFTWVDSDGVALVEGTEYTCEGGITHFDDSTIGRTLHCEMSHAAYPAFSGSDALKTSGMLSAGMPTHLLATFTTTVDGEEPSLSLTSGRENNAVYIDWTGTESLEQYPLATSYTVFTGQTTAAGARVKVWSYDEDDQLTVFSMTGASLADADFSPMHNLIMLAVDEAGLSDIVLPESENLGELSLVGNNFSSFDFARYPNLYYCIFNDNPLKTIDLSGAPNLAFACFTGCELTDVKLGGNDKLWSLALSNNNLSEIDFTGAPNISQMSLNYNNFSEIDLSALSDLVVIYLDHNYLDFSTLPVPQDKWIVYTYGGQANIETECVNGAVDLSRQAERDGVATTYTWFYGLPSTDADTGELTGEELIVDDEYTIAGGVTTFNNALSGVCCVMTNELFPDTYLMTDLIAVLPDGIRETQGATPRQRVCSDLQGRVIANPSRGLYIMDGRKVIW